MSAKVPIVQFLGVRAPSRLRPSVTRLRRHTEQQRALDRRKTPSAY